MFQSYLTGIEIGYRAEYGHSVYYVPIVPYWNWNNELLLYLHPLQFVPIVPYWNWNFANTIVTKAVSIVPIVPYWNWNLFGILNNRSAWDSSNRTLLELKFSKPVKTRKKKKFQSYLTGIEMRQYDIMERRRPGSNRTLLELKFLTNSASKAVNWVPIVPYWNWNFGKRFGLFRPGKVPIVPYWNWNEAQMRQYQEAGCSNRTLLELKSVSVTTNNPTSVFQSYLTGIEIIPNKKNTWTPKVPIVPYWNWNLV